MKILHLASLNNDPEIQPNMGPKCNPVGGEPPNRCSRRLQPSAGARKSRPKGGNFSISVYM